MEKELPDELRRLLLDYKEQWTTNDVMLYYHIDHQAAKKRMKQVDHNNKFRPMVCDSKQLRAWVKSNMCKGNSHYLNEATTRLYGQGTR